MAKKKILVADDDQGILDALTMMLEDAGYEVETTVNGETFAWKRGDTFSAPCFALIEHNVTAREPAFLIRVHDTPLQEKLNYYEERPRPQQAAE